ncbi:hypothetical protein H6503_00325 [Candidatus Woesearchaeota archaeon]|nr:hypothetical protein [Candidatus Woesearchaeota archaeon]
MSTRDQNRKNYYEKEAESSFKLACKYRLDSKIQLKKFNSEEIIESIQGKALRELLLRKNSNYEIDLEIFDEAFEEIMNRFN